MNEQKESSMQQTEEQTEMFEKRAIDRRIARLERVRAHIIKERDKREKAIESAEKNFEETVSILHELDAELSTLREAQKGEPIVVVEVAEDVTDEEPMDESRGVGAPPLEIEAGEVIDEGADVPVEVDAVTGEVVMASEVEEPEYALPTHFADGTPIDGTTAGIVADTDEYVDIFIPDPAPEEKVAAGPADKPRCEECHSSVGHLIGCSKLDAPAVPTGAQIAPTNEAVWVLWPDADDSIELPVGDRTRFGELVANYLNANPQISPTAAYEIIGTTDGELRDPRMVIPTEDWGGEFLLKLAVAQ